jgi:hypothetical protein
MTKIKINNKTKAKLKSVLETVEMRDLVVEYIAARAIAEVTREKVDAVYDQILQEIPVYDTLSRRESERITKHKYLYCTEDEEAVNKIYDLADERLKAAKIKPADMHRDYCPALVAENELTQVQHKIIEIGGEPLGITVGGLLSNGLDSYYRWIELTVGAVVSFHSDYFKNLREA